MSEPCDFSYTSMTMCKHGVGDDADAGLKLYACHFCILACVDAHRAFDKSPFEKCPRGHFQSGTSPPFFSGAPTLPPAG